MGRRTFLLLDTNVLIWLDQDNSSLGPKARKRADLALEQGSLAVRRFLFGKSPCK